MSWLAVVFVGFAALADSTDLFWKSLAMAGVVALLYVGDEIKRSRR